MAKVCIVCYKEVSSNHLVQDDIVIRAIRAIKQRLGNAKNNTLVVCDSCMAEHKKKRESFERSLVMYIALGGLVFLLFAFLPLMSGGFSIASLLLGLVVGGLLVSLSIFRHWPKLATQHAASDGGKKAAKKKKR